jgi:hypothetical protein
MPFLKVYSLLLLILLSGCGWFHARKPPPQPPELTVTGAPAGSILFVDGIQAGPANESAIRPQQLKSTPGSHVLEVRNGETVAYRENFDLQWGERRVITVLSGSNPD